MPVAYMASHSRVAFSLLAAALTLGCNRGTELKGPPPNILLIVMDAARSDHFSCYGYHRNTTPVIDRLAGEGLRFTQTVSSSSWTMPAHASLFTGLLPFEHGTNTQHNWLIDRFPTLAELLKKRGYQTLGISNNPMVDQAQNLSRGFDLFIPVWADSSVVSPRKPHSTEWTNKQVRHFLEHREDKEKPFFIFINYMDAHNPYDPPEPFRSLYLKAGESVSELTDSASHNPELVNSGVLKISEKDFDILESLYDGSINYLDRKIGELLDCLRTLNLFDSTLIVVTSDHGQIFGRWNHFTHGVLLYRPLVQIPLIIRYPPLAPNGALRETPVAITDIFHTLVKIAGIENPPKTSAPVSYLFAPRIEKRACYSEVKVTRGGKCRAERKNDSRSLWTPEGRHFILTDSEAFECYDLSADLEEQNNLCPSLVEKTSVTGEIVRFESGLLRFVETAEDLRITAEQRVDPQHESALRALGYVGGGISGISAEAQAHHPHIMEHLKTSNFFLLRDSLEAAVREARAALAMAPDNLFLNKILAGYLYKQNKFDQASEILTKVVRWGDKDPIAAVLLGQSLFQLGQKDEALKQFQRAGRIDPSNLNAALGCAEICMEKGDFDGAGTYIRKVLENHAGSLAARHRSINLCVHYRNWTLARELLLQEVEKAPSGRALILLGRVSLSMGRKDEGRRYLERALTMNLPPALQQEVERQLKEL
ncbi:MAG TPA: sulfatase-like hydrolase/transferase [archaeon]|nr:sulfatase-like hydrolase/transferase [archaeon]